MDTAMLKDGKTEEYQKKWHQLQRKEQGKEKDHVEDGERRLKRI